MLTVPITSDQAKRLGKLRVLDVKPELELDEISRLAADLFGVPTVVISLVDDERQWIKTQFGMGKWERASEYSNRGNMIVLKDRLVILDTHSDSAVKNHPLVTGAPHIRFYAAVPIALSDKEPVGQICLISNEPREAFSENETSALHTLARQVAHLFEKRQSMREQKIAQLIGDTATDAFVASNSDGDIIYWNRGAENLFGYSLEEALGSPLDIIVPAEHRGAHVAGIKRLRGGGAPRLVGKTIEVPAVHKNGDRLMIELTLSTWTEETGGIPSGFASIMRDVSQRVMTEQRLAEQIAAIEAASEGIAIATTDGIARYMNRAFLEMFGLPPGSSDVPWSHVCAAHERERVAEQAFVELQRAGHWSGDIQGLRSDGLLIDCEVSFTLSENTVVSVIRDMTQRRQSERELARLREQLLLAQRQKVFGQLAAGLAHDFNNLIAAIGGSSALIEATGTSEDAQHARRISSAVRDAGNLVDKLLKMGRRDPDYEEHDLRHIIEDVAELVHSGLEREQRLSLDLVDASVIARVDRSELQQVLLNLALNAREAIQGQPNGNLIVGISKKEIHADQALLVGDLPDGPFAQIWVEDNGIGIANDMLSQIFQPFFTRKAGGGSGLGLAMVASIVEANGAGIAVDSKKDKGSRFTLYWPLEPNNRDRQQVLDASPVDPCALEGLRLLVVDDEPPVAETLAAVFESAGAEVGFCTIADDALESITEDPSAWHVLVTDFDMPGMDGAELVERARKIVPDLPSVLVTALPEANRLKTRGADLFDVIGSKVASPSLLIGMVRESMNRRNLENSI